MISLFFWGFGGLAVVAALLCVTRKSAVASALWLVVTMFALAAIYVLLDAQFIAVIQILVYAGAIMVLFLFVIMLLNLGRMTTSDIKPITSRLLAGAAGVLLLAELFVLRKVTVPAALLAPEGSMEATLAAEGAVNAVAKPMFVSYLVPFEITSVMLLAAVVGAVVLAKRRL